MKKFLLKYISILLIAAFISTNIASSYPVIGSGITRERADPVGSNLAVQLPSKPIFDPSIKSAMRLKSHLAYMVKLKDDFFDNEHISHEANGVSIHFGGSVFLDIDSVTPDEGAGLFRIIPCNVDAETFYLYHYRTPEGVDSFDVQSPEQFKIFSQDFVSRGVIRPEERQALLAALDLEKVTDIAILDPMDESIVLVNGFFDSIEAVELKNKFNEFIRWLPVLSVKGSAESYETIVVDKALTPGETAWTIIERFFYLAFNHDASSDIKVIRKAYNIFMDRGSTPEYKKMYGSEIYRDIKAILFATDIASNEGGLYLPPEVFETMVDLSGITMEMCEEKGIVDDIRNIFNSVIEHELNDYNENAPRDQQISLEQMPGYKEKLIVRKISNGVFPTVISRGNGNIIVNETFVKMMYRFAEKGMKEAEGELLGVEGDERTSKRYPYWLGRPALGNFYESVIYSIAIHEIRGHYNISEAKIQFDPSEENAQGIRGRKFLYVNVMSMIFFINIVSRDRRLLNVSFALQETIEEKYMETLLRHLEKKHAKRIAKAITNNYSIWFLKEIFPDGFDHEIIPVPDDPLPEIPELAELNEKETAPLKLLDVFAQISSRKSVFSVEDLAGAFGLEADKGLEHLVAVFLDWNLIRKAGETNGTVLYRIADLSDTEIANVIALLTEVPEPYTDQDLNAVGVPVKDITAKYIRHNVPVTPSLQTAWSDIIRVYDFLLLQRGEPITVTELVDFLYKKSQGEDRELREKTVSEAAAYLLRLGLLRHDIRTSSYRLIDILDIENRSLTDKVKYLLLSVETAPGSESTDLSGIKSAITDIIESNYSELGRQIADNAVIDEAPAADPFWKDAAEVFDVLAGEGRAVNLSNLSALAGRKDTAALKQVLETLVQTGAIQKYRPAMYSVRRLAAKQKYDGISGLFRSIYTPVRKTDIKKLKALVFRKYAMNRTWLNVLGMVPFLVSMNEVYMVLVKEGLDDSRRYSVSQIADFYKEVEEKYFGTNSGVSREQVIAMLTDIHRLDPISSALLDHRIQALERYGRISEPWTFSARALFVYAQQIKETLGKSTSESEPEGDLYRLISRNLLDEEKLDIDLFILQDLGVLSEMDRDFTYSLAKFFDPLKLRERILRIGDKRLKVPVQTGHYQKIRDVLFANVPPTWPIASFVFRSLQMNESRTVNGENLLANMNSGVDKGSWNMFSAVLEYLNRLGIIHEYTVPGLYRKPVTGEEFNRSVITAIPLSGEEMERFDRFVGSIGSVKQENFINIFPDKQDRFDLVQDLFTRGYINRFKKVSSVFRGLDSYQDLKFTGYFEKKKQITDLQRKKIYKILDEARMELTFSNDGSDIERMRRKFVLEVLDPRPRGAFYVFEKIRALLKETKTRTEASGIHEPGYPSFTDLLGAMPNVSAARLSPYLTFLVRTGLIEEIDDHYYRPVRMYGSQIDKVSNILDVLDRKIDLKDDDDLTLTTTRILSVTEPLWANRFLDDLSRVVSKISKEDGEGPGTKVLLAFDTSWIPLAQKNHVMDILRAVSKLHNITLVISDTPGNLAAKIEQEKKHIPWKNVITFVNKDALVFPDGTPGSFWKTYNHIDKEKLSHIIGIDNSNLSEDTYVRLLEMISMAYEHAFSIWEQPLRHPHIEAIITKTREHPILSRKYIIFIPDTEKISIDHIPAVYRAQVKLILQSA